MPPLTLTRKPGQGGSAEAEVRDLRAELLAAESAHRARLQGGANPDSVEAPETAATTSKRALETETQADDEDDPEVKRRRVLEETRDIDADDSEEDDDDESDDSDDEDETAELQRELEKIKQERAAKREQEVSDVTATTP